MVTFVDGQIFHDEYRVVAGANRQIDIAVVIEVAGGHSEGILSERQTVDHRKSARLIKFHEGDELGPTSDSQLIGTVVVIVGHHKRVRRFTD